ncbi:MAG: TonB-dependent receptor [Cytophagaceae bacterium]
MKSILLSTALIFLHFISPAQTSFNIKGKVIDALSKEALPGATITISELNKNVISDDNGEFLVTLPQGKYTISVLYLGYQTIKKTINLQANAQLEFAMQYEEMEVEEVVIKGEKENENVQAPRMSNVQINIEEIKKLPALFGEVDVMKNLQMMPGIQVAGEGNTGLYVRGGGADQNLVLLDEAPVYNPAHLLGIFSIFNSDVLKSAEIYKGGIPAQYGGRLSSLVDIHSKAGSMDGFHGSGGISNIASRLTLETPIVKNRSSLLLAGRRTYMDMFLKLSSNPEIRNNTLYFYDLNGTYSHTIDDKNKIFISGYHGRDVFSFRDLFGVNWGNTTGSIQWRRYRNERFYSNWTLAYSGFDYTSEFDMGIQSLAFTTGIREYLIKKDYFLQPNNRHNLAFGTFASYRRHFPGKVTPGSPNSMFRELEMNRLFSLESGAYASNRQTITKRFEVEYGLRFTIFSQLGKGEVFTYEGEPANGIITDTTTYERLESIKDYYGVEPRLSARYTLTEASSVKASYNRTYQYLHLMSNSTAPLPLNMWMPSTVHIRPQSADQVAAGYFRNFLDGKIETSVEAYYKYMNNAVDFKDFAQIFLNPNIETEIRRGVAWSYGLEFFIRKIKGKTTGWISYTLSKTERRIPGINQGMVYPADFDRRHNLNLVLTHDLSKRWNISGNWVYGSGRPMTLPAARYSLDYMDVSYYTERNAYRMPSYHRMDLAVNYSKGQREDRRWYGSWSLSVYNVYGRKNPFTIFPQDKADAPGEKEIVMIYLFRQLPALTYNFNF